jgi:hypothetical protein
METCYCRCPIGCSFPHSQLRIKKRCSCQTQSHRPLLRPAKTHHLSTKMIQERLTISHIYPSMCFFQQFFLGKAHFPSSNYYQLRMSLQTFNCDNAPPKLSKYCQCLLLKLAKRLKCSYIFLNKTKIPLQTKKKKKNLKITIS